LTQDLIKSIGISLRDLRLHQKVSQKELSKGICTQSYISMIEHGEISPSAHILYSFSSRLGVDISYFFETFDNNMFEYLSEFKAQVRYATEKNDFKSVRTLINSQKDNPYFKRKKMRNFFAYHSGLCNYYLDHNLDKSIETLTNTLSYSEESTNGEGGYFQEDLESLLSIAVIYTEEKLWDQAVEYYKKAFELVGKRPRLDRTELAVRLYYNYIRYLYSTKQYNEVVKLARKGINCCLELKTFYLFGELYYYKGICHLEGGEEEEGRKALAKAKAVFEISNNKSYITYIDNARA
jgi:transcriptional regulator with XRE-family HTH domain